MHERPIVALESRQEANYAKEKFDVGLMNFDLNQSQTLLSNAQSDVLRTKYDYIFKIKILEFYFGILIIKTNTLCQRNQFILIGGAVVALFY
jgi:outer membrane protein